MPSRSAHKRATTSEIESVMKNLVDDITSKLSFQEDSAPSMAPPTDSVPSRSRRCGKNSSPTMPKKPTSPEALRQHGNNVRTARAAGYAKTNKSGFRKRSKRTRTKKNRRSDKAPQSPSASSSSDSAPDGRTPEDTQLRPDVTSSCSCNGHKISICVKISL